MPIVDLQRRVMEVGRIRLGERDENKGFPKRLDTWRLTSRDETRIRAAADVYGGTVERWERGDAWEVVTDSDTLRVVLIPGQTISQWWEAWGTKGRGAHRCLKRCDGRWDYLNDKACSCPPAGEQRKSAKDACELRTMLSVLLPDLPGIGMWRLVTSSYYAAMELPGISELLETLSARGEMRPARLRIDKRKGVLPDGTATVYPVPVLDVDLMLNPAALTSPVEEPYHGALEAPPTLGPAAAVEELRRRELEPPSRQGRQTADIGPSGFVPSETPLPQPEEFEAGPAPAAPPAASTGDQTFLDTAPIEGAAKRLEEPTPEPEASAEPEAEATPPAPVPPAPAPTDDTGVAGFISQAQRRKLFALARQVGLSEDQLRELVAHVNDGDTSTGSLPVEKFDGLLELVANAGEIVNTGGAS